MLCAKPFVKSGNVTAKGLRRDSREARLAATPLPCGQCLHCRINKARIWSHRILLESASHPFSTFVGLTYEDSHLTYTPKGLMTLNPRDLTLFLKKFRARIYPRKIRYYAVGEYGEEKERPHFHLVIFNSHPFDKQDLLLSWGKGNVDVGDVCMYSARYIAGYTTEKLSLDKRKLNGRHPVFMRSSKGKSGGIGLQEIKRVGNVLLLQPYFKPRLIREFNRGKRILPLGRYLTRKLAEVIGLDPQAFIDDFYNYQEQIFAAYLDDSGQYYRNFVMDHEPKRKRQLARRKIFNGKKRKGI